MELTVSGHLEIVFLGKWKRTKLLFQALFPLFCHEDSSLSIFPVFQTSDALEHLVQVSFGPEE